MRQRGGFGWVGGALRRQEALAAGGRARRWVGRADEHSFGKELTPYVGVVGTRIV